MQHPLSLLCIWKNVPCSIPSMEIPTKNVSRNVSKLFFDILERDLLFQNFISVIFGFNFLVFNTALPQLMNKPLHYQ